MGSKGYFILASLIVLTLLVVPLVFQFLNGFNGSPKVKNTIKNVNQYTVTQPYQFPVVPGTDKWFQLSSHVEKTQVCLIPNNILKKMTTEALVETVLSYPLLSDMFAYSTEKEGYDAVFKQFNGLSELSERPNAVEELTNVEKSLAPYKEQSNIMGLKELNVRWILKGIKKNN